MICLQHTITAYLAHWNAPDKKSVIKVNLSLGSSCDTSVINFDQTDSWPIFTVSLQHGPATANPTEDLSAFWNHLNLLYGFTGH